MRHPPTAKPLVATPILEVDDEESAHTFIERAPSPGHGAESRSSSMDRTGSAPRFRDEFRVAARHTSRRECPVYVAKSGSMNSRHPSRYEGGHSSFWELLRKLAEEHDRVVEASRENLLAENARLREENTRLHFDSSRAESEQQHARSMTAESSRKASEREPSSGSGERFHHDLGSLPPSRWSTGQGCDDVQDEATCGNTLSLLITASQSVDKQASQPSDGQASAPQSSKEIQLAVPSRAQALEVANIGVKPRRRPSALGIPMSPLPSMGARAPSNLKALAGSDASPGNSTVGVGGTELRREDLARLLGSGGRDRCMISPVSRTRLLWDFVAFSCLLVDLWMTPVELVFMDEGIVPVQFAIVNYVITAFFVVDIALNFSTGFIDRDKLVLQRAPSIRKYLSFWFWVDVMATVPFDLLIRSILSSFDGEVLNMTRLARLTKVTKVLKTLRFLKMARAIRIVQQMGRANNFMDMFEPLKYVARIMQLVTGLCFLAHLHGCIWALLQPNMAHQREITQAFFNYYSSFRWAYNAITVGEMDSALNENPGVWTLEMIISSERILMALVLGGWGIVKALTIFQEDAQLNVVKSAAVRFFRQHEVSIETQISVLYSLHETNDAQKMQRHFKNLMSEHLPDELRRTVSEELWVRHLTSLGLIMQMRWWHEDFLPELSLVVREEVVASKTVLCKEGHASIAAYYILKGRLVVANSRAHGIMPDFTDGMWVEETALVSPVRRRCSTIVTPILTRLMTVPTQAFHDLIMSLGLEFRFQEFKETQLARGLCGRCGDVGDHFTHACPQANNPGFVRQRRLSASRKKRISDLRGDMEGSLSLNAFLHAHRLTGLAPLLKEQRIHSKADLEELDFERMDAMLLGNDDMKKQLSLLHVLVKEQQEEVAFNVHNERASAQHLAFLSHYKMESGTEAALMRQEMERVLMEDDQSPAHNFQVPVFLDSEDLSDLEELEEHVRRSHNLVLLLTKDVLSRPWVLVEIVTAIETDVRLVPVEVNKRGAGFTFPDEDYYAKLLAGKVLDTDSQALLRERGIELKDVERGLRDVFNKIALPYSPHRAESIRMAEIKAIYKQLLFRDAHRLQAF